MRSFAKFAGSVSDCRSLHGQQRGEGAGFGHKNRKSCSGRNCGHVPPVLANSSVSHRKKLTSVSLLQDHSVRVAPLALFRHRSALSDLSPLNLVPAFIFGIKSMKRKRVILSPPSPSPRVRRRRRSSPSASKKHYIARLSCSLNPQVLVVAPFFPLGTLGQCTNWEYDVKFARNWPSCPDIVHDRHRTRLQDPESRSE